MTNFAALARKNGQDFPEKRWNGAITPHIGQVLPVRITASEVIIYSVGLEEIACHRLVPGTQTGVRQTLKSHHPQSDPGERERLLRQRYAELGPLAEQFLEGLFAKQVQGGAVAVASEISE